MKPIIDERLYTVTAPNGYRKSNLTQEEAKQHAARLREQMKKNGWAGKVRVYYRDGSLVRDD